MRTIRRKLIEKIFAAWLALAIACGARAADEAPVCLLTGFDPFADYKINMSWETAKALDGTTIAGHRVVAVRLPVVYDEIAAPLEKAIAEQKPRIVIGMGVGTKVVQIETVARNGYHPYKPKDNKGNKPPREEIAAGGAATIPTALPGEKIVEALKSAGIGSQTSTDAGGYLCNECFYRVMSYSGPSAGGIKARGFIHVPDVGLSDPLGGTFTPEKLVKAIQTAIETTANPQR